MCWPPAPLARNVSIRRSLGSSSNSTGSALGITATVIVDVWIRPCVSVSGTHCTRCTPLSNFMRLYTLSPSIINDISLMPPSSVSFSFNISTLHFWRAAYILYIRNTLWANKAASSPPAPLRISTITPFSSLGSCGKSKILRFCRSGSNLSLFSQNCCCTIALNSGSNAPESKSSLASA